MDLKPLFSDNTHFSNKIDSARLPVTSPGGIHVDRLQWLCQPEQIEQTLLLLFHLNHWAKARDQFLYADRQGLYQIKEVLLQQAYCTGQLVPSLFIDGSQEFAQDFSPDAAAMVAADVLAFQLTCLMETEHIGITTDHQEEHTYRRLYQKITGHQTMTSVQIEALDEEQVAAYIQAEVERLVEQARTTHQPIPVSALEDLLISPSDLVPISTHRYIESWEDLNKGDLRVIDPEGLSLLAFDYTGSTAHYTFHLPLRIAEQFIPADVIATLRKTTGRKRETGTFYGRVITEEESHAYPLETIIRELQVDISLLCPHQLIDKNIYIAQRQERRSMYMDIYDADDDLDEFDEMEAPFIEKPVQISAPQKSRNSFVSDECPLCSHEIGTPPLRIFHWREQHGAQDLTVGQVAWIIGTTKTDLKASFSLAPDYRGASDNGYGKGTRFWKVEALERYLQESGGAIGQNT